MQQTNKYYKQTDTISKQNQQTNKYNKQKNAIKNKRQKTQKHAANKETNVPVEVHFQEGQAGTGIVQPLQAGSCLPLQARMRQNQTYEKTGQN